MKIKQFILSLLLALSLSLTTVSTSVPQVKASQTANSSIRTVTLSKKSKKKAYVYVTTSGYGKKYHRKNCRTIKRSHIKKLKKSTAKKRGYKRCKVCKP